MVDPGQAIGWRVWAWAKLVKVWGSLRWSDLQAIIPAELSLVEGRLATLGLPLEVQGYWTERSERSVLPTALSLQDIPPHEDLLGRWKPEGSDVYARSFGGRVARPQALFADVADRYQKLDEREIAADLVPWLMERPGLSREQAELTVEGLRRSWKEGGLGAADPAPATLASEEPLLGEPTGDGDPGDSSQAPR